MKITFRTFFGTLFYIVFPRLAIFLKLRIVPKNPFFENIVS